MHIEIRLSMKAVGLLCGVAFTTLAYGHGTPILIDVVGSKLAVSGGTTDDDGFASMLYFEDDEEGDPFGPITLPGPNPAIRWQLPGLNIFGMDDQSSLSIEVLARPVKDAVPAENRLIWFWNPASEFVEAAPATAAMYLLGTGMRLAAIGPPDGVAPPPFLLAQTVQGQTGFHNHGLLQYALDDSPAALPGAYGFFARFLSNQYAASDPFLLVFNYGVAYEQMTMAALAINAVAADPDAPPGDYNDDGIVDAADYTVWRDGLGSIYDEDDYEMWKAHYGQMGSGGNAGSFAAAVPEPDNFALATIVITGTLLSARFPSCRLTASCAISERSGR